MSSGQAPTLQASEVLPAVRADDQRGPDLQVLPTLAECEQVIERGKRSWFEAGMALAAIHEGRLYGDAYPTFEAYCRDRWGWSRITAYRHMKAARETALLPAGNRPATEREARRLRSVTPEDSPIDEDQERLWDRLIDALEVIEALSSSDAPVIAATVPYRRRAAIAKRLRKLGTYMGRIAWSLESEGTPE